MKPDHHISELLYDHDCVIVPGLGGFVANYQPASIHPTQHIFSPPYKRIAFNRSLQNNDGLLANHIASAEKISFPEAGKVIRNYSEECNKTLGENKKVVVEKVGTLFCDVEKNIQFTPDASINYLYDSWGLSPVQFPPVKREEQYKRPELEFLDRPAIPAIRTRGWARKHAWKLALLVPVIVLGAWASLHTEKLQEINYSYLNPFADSSWLREKFFPAPAAPTTDIREKLPVLQPAAAPAVAEQPAPSSSPVEETNTPSPTPSPQPATPPPSLPSQEPMVAADKRFFIIGGCFSVYANAERLVGTLQKKGFPASIIGKSPKGLDMVSYDGFTSQEEARALLDIVKSEYDSTAWLYQRN